MSAMPPMDRRAFTRWLGRAGIGAALFPHRAWAKSSSGAGVQNLPHMRAVLERWVGAGKFPGLVASLGQAGQAAQFITVGSEGFLDPDPMRADSLFRIYSMTKPVTGMAAMELIAQGKMALDQPLYDILPQFRQMQVQNQYDGSITEVHPASRPITLRHLLTHTSGLGYSIIQCGPIKTLMENKGLVPGQITRLKLAGFSWGEPVKGLAAFAERLAQVPLVADPGTRWSYSVGLDLMARVIEVVSGMPFEHYLYETILGPCGMTSTSFQVPHDQAHRLTTNYGALGQVLVPIDEGATSVFLDKPAFAFGGSGLVSTPQDYDRFLHMLANYGRLDGRRILHEEAVRIGTSNLLPAGVSIPAAFGGPAGFGAGGRVGLGSEAGVFGWSGAAGTVGMVDMLHGFRSQIFAQFMPPNAVSLLPEFQTALKADIRAILENR